MTISLRLNNEDAKLFKRYAEMHGITISDLIRESVKARIEDELDLAEYEKAMAEYRANPRTYTLDEVYD